MDERYKVGDKVWFIKTFREIYWWIYTKTPPKPLKHPIEKKITQVVHTKNETLYQVKDGHFPESWIGDIVFDTKEEAYRAIKG
jgi:hypothetical protein